MEPIRDTHATLVDLLDRVLDKGLVINADLIISVAGIPLIGITLKAALAGMETMLKYGIMQAWDEQTRAWEREYRKKKEMQGREKVTTEIIPKREMTAIEDEMETCPLCGRKASVRELLQKGCSRCGWVSPKLKKTAVVSS